MKLLNAFELCQSEESVLKLKVLKIMNTLKRFTSNVNKRVFLN
jgi:hypothetical protein